MWSRVHQPLTWTVGLAWISHEVFIQDGQRPYLLAAITGVMGVQAMYKRDRAAEEAKE